MTIKSTVVREGNIGVVNKEVAMEILGENDFANNLSYVDSGAGSTLLNFVLVGQVSATKAIKVCDADTPAVDGSQIPFGLLWLGLNNDVTVGAGLTKTGLSVVIKGRIDESLISFGATATTLDTVLNGITVREYLNNRGIWFLDPVENSNFTEV